MWGSSEVDHECVVGVAEGSMPMSTLDLAAYHIRTFHSGVADALCGTRVRRSGCAAISGYISGGMDEHMLSGMV